jgi:glycosyltransferase involved in cell wall biosynthesis
MIQRRSEMQTEQKATKMGTDTTVASGMRSLNVPNCSTSLRASVVIVTHNEGEMLSRTIEALVETTPPGTIEIIVADDQSTDGSTAHLPDVEASVELVRTPRRLGVARARNLGAQSATAPILVFSDAHVLPDPEWLEPLCLAVGWDGAAAAAPAIRPLNSHGAAGFGFTWRTPTLETAWLGGPPER